MKDFAFAPIPMRAMADTRLSAGHFRALAVICAHDRFGRNDTGCLASHTRLADMTCTHYTKFSKHVADLQRMGYIERRPHPRTKKMRHYAVLYTPEDEKAFNPSGADSCRNRQPSDDDGAGIVDDTVNNGGADSLRSRQLKEKFPNPIIKNTPKGPAGAGGDAFHSVDKSADPEADETSVPADSPDCSAGGDSGEAPSPKASYGDRWKLAKERIHEIIWDVFFVHGLIDHDDGTSMDPLPSPFAQHLHRRKGVIDEWIEAIVESPDDWLSLIRDEVTKDAEKAVNEELDDQALHSLIDQAEIAAGVNIPGRTKGDRVLAFQSMVPAGAGYQVRAAIIQMVQCKRAEDARKRNPNNPEPDEWLKERAYSTFAAVADGLRAKYAKELVDA